MKKLSDYSMHLEKVLQDKTYPGGNLSELYEPISYALSAGGKRLRPSLVLMAADAFGGNAEEAVEAAIGMEMFHNFTLLHDDVMDRSPLRRSRPTVHAKWDENTAILSGDTMLTLATLQVMKVGDGVLRRVLDVFNAMAIRVYEGQRLDMDFEKSDSVSLDDYMRMISDKTGALLGASAEIGALIGGAGEEDARRMADYGEALGKAFQIQDDWLDVFGDSSTFGKPIGGDINNNKKTFLYHAALAKGTADTAAFREAMKLPPGDTKVRAVTRLYERMDMSQTCKAEIAKYSKEAIKAIKKTSMSESAREEFRKLVDKLTGRKK